MKRFQTHRVFLGGALVATCALAAPGSRNIVHPMVDIHSDVLLGASQNGKWIKPALAARSLRGGEIYRVYNLKKQSAQGRGTKPHLQGAPCEKTLFMRVEPSGENAELALGASWNALPRAPRPQNPTQKAYIAAVSSHLKQKGIAQPRVHIVQLWRVDLEGDGVEEVLVSAAVHRAKAVAVDGRDWKAEGTGVVRASSSAGDYSVVLLRKIVGGKLQTIVLEDEYYPKARSFSAPNIFTLAGVLDANGDGRLEIVTRADYYEGGYTSVFEVRGGRASKVLEEGCGA